MGSRTAPSSHALGKRVHAMLVGALLTDLLGGCGPSGQPSGSWQYGGGERPVLSWPVMDDDGNLFVLVGVDAKTASDQSIDVGAVDLVSLDSAGAERWSVEIAGSMTTQREARVRPIVGPAGDVWVHFDEALVRVSAAGRMVWEHSPLPDPEGYGGPPITSQQAALDVSGVYYALPRVEIDTSFQKQQLRAIGPGGDELWRFDPGVPGQSGADFNPVPTQTDAPLVDADGHVMVGCDTCVEGGVGVARFDPQSGEPAMLLSVPGSSPFRYRQILWDGQALWANLAGQADESGLWTVTSEGTTMRPSHAIGLAASSGNVWAEDVESGSSSFTVNWGDDAIGVIVPADLPSAELEWVNPVCVAHPAAVLLEFQAKPAFIDGEVVDERGLLLIDLTGAVVWHAGGMFRDREPVPAIGDGFIAYIEADTQRLVAVEAPVERVADGPWPIIGGDPQGTRSAEQK